MIFDASLDTSHHGPPHQFKDAGAVADGLTAIHSEVSLRYQQELHKHRVLDFQQVKIQKIQIG
jgi:hypothetical protein